ncbi:hypothetical protein BKA56DRAFT_121771 [Ilyonectria sp. MPI-CAGE-AT-0026]|nr:hypothetical protein BKA56DRAFT_121771 [Ilyonectria sp. MPI-CAGE-AT-0026]
MGQGLILLALGILQLLFVTAWSRIELALFPSAITAPRSVGASGCQESRVWDYPRGSRWFLVVLGTSSCTSPSGKHTQSQGNFSRVDGSHWIGSDGTLPQGNRGPPLSLALGVTVLHVRAWVCALYQHYIWDTCCSHALWPVILARYAHLCTWLYSYPWVHSCQACCDHPTLGHPQGHHPQGHHPTPSLRY